MPGGAGGARTNLPVPLTSFVGRARERARAEQLVDAARLTTLTGPGGAGKTRLAVTVGRMFVRSRPGGVWFVDLAACDDGEAVPAAIGDAMSGSGEPLATLDDVARVVDSTPTLVVLDNCERVVAAVADAAVLLLERCSGLSLLATSREPLRVPGEAVLRVPSLAMPDESARPAAELAAFDAVELFVERARHADPDFELRDDLGPVVAEICRRLDGLPLAIELAAARAGVLGPAGVLAGLDQRFRLLADGPRTAAARHRSLEASVAWSDDLLAGPERTVLRRLSVLGGGFTLDTATAVAAADGIEAGDVTPIVLRLVDQSLVVAIGTERFRLLESVREFAAARLDPAERHAAVARLHAHLVEALRLTPAGGDAADHVVRRVAADYENIRRALAWAAEQDDPAPLSRLARRVYPYWADGRRSADGVRWLEQVVAAETDPARRAQTLHRAAVLYMGLGQHARATRAEEEALPVLRAAGRPAALAEALLTPFARDLETRRARTTELVEVADRLGAVEFRGHARRVQGYMELSADPDEADRILAEAHALAEAGGLESLARPVRAAIAVGRVLRGEVAEVLPALEASVAELESGGMLAHLGQGLNLLAVLRELAGRPGAEGPIDRLAALADDGAAVFAVARMAHDARAGVALLQGRWPDAERELAATDRLPVTPIERRPAHEHRAMLHALEGRGDEAEHHLDRAAALAPDDPAGNVMTAFHHPAELVRAVMALRAGEPTEAENQARAALTDLRDGPRPRYTRTLAVTVLAGAVAGRGDAVEAVRLLGAADGDARLGGMSPDHAVLRAVRGDLGPTLRAALGAGEFAEAWDEGAAMRWREVVAAQTRGRGVRNRPASGWAALTPTEREVADVVATGATNREAAARLFMSAETVKSHLKSVYAKLGLRSRTELAAAVASARDL